MPPIRALNAQEIAHLRSGGHRIRLALASMEHPPVIFQAVCSQSPASHDGLLEIKYSSGSGTLGNVLPGMTLWIGTYEGGYDVGMARIRKAPTSDTLYIGETSEIRVQNGHYLTVVDEMLPWPKHVRILNKVPYMDGDIAYTDQHDSPAPVPVFGSDVVVYAKSYPVDIPFDSTDTWCLGSGTISRQWSASAGTFVGGTTGVTATLRLDSYPPGGVVRVKLTATRSGKSANGYRYVYVYDPEHLPFMDFTLNSLVAGSDSGGWEFSVTCYGDVSWVRDRARVILFALEEGFGDGHTGGVGVLPGRENIVCSGWIDGESIRLDSNARSVTFTVRGLHHWLDRMPGFPPGVEARRPESAPAWTNFPVLTVDHAAWHLLYWRSTVAEITDVYLTGDTRTASAFDIPSDGIFSQLREIGQSSILAIPGVDRYGRLFMHIDPQFVLPAQRSVIKILTATDDDILDEGREIEVVETPQIAMVELSGVAATATTAAPYFSRSPGSVFARTGDILIMDRLLLSGQSQANHLAALVFGRENRRIRSIRISFAHGGYRVIDIFPFQYVHLSLNNDRFSWSGRALPRSIQYQMDGTGVLRATFTFEPETFPGNSISYYPPGPQPPPVPPPPSPPPTPPPPTPGPAPVPPSGDQLYAIVATNRGLAWTENLLEGNPVWRPLNDGLEDDVKGTCYQFIVLDDGLIVGAFGNPTTSMRACWVGITPWFTIADSTIIQPGPFADGPFCVSLFGSPFPGILIIVAGHGPSDQRIFRGGASDAWVQTYQQIDIYSWPARLLTLGTDGNMTGIAPRASGVLKFARIVRISPAGEMVFYGNSPVSTGSNYSPHPLRAAGWMLMGIGAVGGGGISRLRERGLYDFETGFSSTGYMFGVQDFAAYMGRILTGGYRSENLGDTWESVPSPGRCLYAVNADEYVHGQSYIAYSSDFGLTWQTKTGNLWSVLPGYGTPGTNFIWAGYAITPWAVF